MSLAALTVSIPVPPRISNIENETPPIDFDRLQLVAETDQEKASLLEFFFKTAEDILDEMKEASRSDAVSQWKNAAHKLRGAAANIGMTNMEKICLKSEKMAWTSPNLRNALLQKLIDEISRTKKFVAEEALIPPSAEFAIASPLPSELSQLILASPILIVDDVEINCVFLEKTLRARGFHNLLCVASAEEALAKIKGFQPDLVLLDILMPGGMNGFECCETLRRQKEYRDLPILMETSIVEPTLRVKAFKKGATDFVSKPIDADELSARVIVHLEKRHSLKTLQLYKKRVETELESARQLQLGILPEPEKIEECRRRDGLALSYAFEPASEIGGDFWGLQNIFPHQTALWLADLSGHGMPAALNAFRLHAYLKEHSPEAARPGEYLSQLNDKLLNLLPRGQFATMFYGIIDTQSGQLFYSRAYMPNPIILHRGSGKTEKLDGSAPPLGIGMHLYPTQTIPFTSDDVLLLYSDALVESADKNGEFITEEQIMECVEKNSAKSVPGLKEILLRHFKEHAGDALRDDLTIVVCAQE